MEKSPLSTLADSSFAGQPMHTIYLPSSNITNNSLCSD
uniref:Uncharacterized protein n=1 Tax=Arundo donax TaxID=35708 RepID=A0A0A9EIB4_ARUDO